MICKWGRFLFNGNLPMTFAALTSIEKFHEEQGFIAPIVELSNFGITHVTAIKFDDERNLLICSKYRLFLESKTLCRSAPSSANT